jgi:hypothetical protein
MLDLCAAGPRFGGEGVLHDCLLRLSAASVATRSTRMREPPAAAARARRIHLRSGRALFAPRARVRYGGAAMRDDLARDSLRVTEKMSVFGADP